MVERIDFVQPRKGKATILSDLLCICTWKVSRITEKGHISRLYMCIVMVVRRAVLNAHAMTSQQVGKAKKKSTPRPDAPRKNDVYCIIYHQSTEEHRVFYVSSFLACSPRFSLVPWSALPRRSLPNLRLDRYTVGIQKPADILLMKPYRPLSQGERYKHLHEKVRCGGIVSSVPLAIYCPPS